MSFSSRLVGAVVAMSTTIGLGAVAGPAWAAEPLPPKVLSLSVEPAAVTVPAAPTVTLRVTGPERPVYAQVTFVEPSGRQRTVQLTTGDTGTGEYPASGPLQLRDGVENGHWTVKHVYLPTMSMSSFVCDTSVQESYCTDHEDFSAAGLDVSGSVFDPDAPVVSSVAVESPTVHVPDQTLDLAFDIGDIHPITRFELQFRPDAPEAQGRYLSVVVRDPAQLTAGRASVSIPNAYDSTYRLRSIITTDSVGNKATYSPNGSVYLEYGATGPKKHTLDFSTVSFTASGSTMDVTPPTLMSVVPGVTKVVQGATATVPVRYSATDAADTLGLVYVCYSTNNAAEVCRTPGTVGYPKAGTVDFPTPSTGVYRLTRVFLRDPQYNTIEYRRDSSTYSAVTKTTGTHRIDFAAADLTVVPPAPAPAVRARPQSAEVTWAASDAGTTGVRVEVTSNDQKVATLQGIGQTGKLTVTGLRNATHYVVTVTPQSTAGDGTANSFAVVPLMARNVVAAGDVNKDGRSDIFAQLPGTGRLRLYRGTNAPGFTAGSELKVLDPDGSLRAGGAFKGQAGLIEIDGDGFFLHHRLSTSGARVETVGGGYGWDVRFLDGSSDFTGDGIADVVTVRHNGDAYLYPGGVDGGVGKGRRIATGWGPMQTVFAARDVTGNRTADLLAVDASGALWVYPGTGVGTFASPVRVGTGWGGLGALFAANDLTGDGKVDLGAITMDGTFRVYPGRSNAKFGAGIAVSKGWQAYL